MKIDFNHIVVYTDLEKSKSAITDARKSVANTIYQQGQGLAFHALALKIWNGNEETEYDEEECGLIMKVVEACYAPCFIDAMREIILKQHEEGSK